MNPAEWLARTAQRSPEAPALFHGDEKVATYAEFAQWSASIGSYFRQKGLAPGDRIAVFMPNSPDYLIVLYGIWYAGLTAVPINGKLHPKEVAWIAENSGAKLLFVAEEGKMRSADDIGNLPEMVEVGGTEYENMKQAEPLSWPQLLVSDHVVWLFYTSGTTGRPKGAMLSCGNLAAMTMCYLADVDRVTPDDAALYAAPMSHGAGLYNFIHVLIGARHVVPKSGRFDPAEILEIAPRIGNISMFAAPTMVKRLIETATHLGSTGDGIKTIVYGGGPMYVADIKAALKALGPKFVQIYGQGESPMCISALSREDIADSGHPDWDARLASVGRAQSIVNVRVVDENGENVPTGEVGEIVVRGAPVMQGYLDNPQANVKSLRDGWLWTGDVGRMDANGYLYLQDRSNDVVISGGTNIYPREVEEALLKHPAVNEVAVVGAPDTEWGEIVVAFVVVTSGSTADAGELDEACRREIASFKKPKKYIFVDELPKNNYGKVQKTVLRQRLSNGGGKD